MGKEMYSPLGVTIIGGLLVSALVSLILIPAIYTSINEKSELKSANK
jgi:multidrug efflux pump subunit AcrB